MAASYPLKVDQGETFRLSLVYALPGPTSDDPVVPIDITDYTARMQIREKYASPVLVEATTENGGIEIVGEEGRINLVLTDVQTDTLGAKGDKPRTSALYDLEIVSPGGDVKRVVEGSVTINPNITRIEATGGSEGGGA